MENNFFALLGATLIPLVVGFIWYHPKVFGNTWMALTGVTPDSAKKTNMALLFGLSALFAFFISFSMQFIVIHQFGVKSLLGPQPDFNTPGSESAMIFEKIKELYWSSYRTFKHGAFHGTLTGLLLVMPAIATNALFEGRGFKYIAITAGYWIVSMALIGGVICAFL